LVNGGAAAVWRISGWDIAVVSDHAEDVEEGDNVRGCVAMVER
jgi:hypothetical protein